MAPHSQADIIDGLRLILQRDLILSGRIRQYRAVAGLSLGECGKAAGATGAEAGLWETGKLTPTASQFCAWAGFVVEKMSWRENAGE